MKIFYFVLGLLLITRSYSQNYTTYRWTWMTGDQNVNRFGFYGQKGVEDVNNHPGSRSFTTNWQDANGMLWVFGGQGYGATTAGNLNDLWRYNPATKMWTWMSGDKEAAGLEVTGALETFSPNYKPVAREAASGWTDATGNYLYLFGGWSPSFNWQSWNDVWVYSTLSNQWSPVRRNAFNPDGSCRGQTFGTPNTFQMGTYPGCRSGAAAASSGSFAYVFGGRGGYHDFFRFADNSSGSDKHLWACFDFPLTVNQPSNYGSPGWPGSRVEAMSFTHNGKFYLYGGTGKDESGIDGQLNDLWEFIGLNPTTNKAEWAFRKGVKTANSPGSYSAYGVTNGTNLPRGRAYGTIRRAPNNQYLLFGGGDGPVLNDLWSYDVSTNSWTWLSGNNAVNIAGFYGSKTVQSSLNVMRGRAGQAMWVLANGDVYVFGGWSGNGHNNDMWRFSPQEEPTPTNDEPCNALAITLDASPAFGSNAFATSTGDIMGTCPGVNSVWYKYTPAASGRVQFTLGAGLSGDTLNSYLNVFVPTSANCPSSMQLVDSTATTFGSCKYYYTPINRNETVFSAFLTAGRTYYFKIAGIANDVGRYSFSMQSTTISNVKTGYWHDPGIWSNNRVPTDQSDVTITSPVTINQNAFCKSITLQSGNQLTIAANAKLTVSNQ